MTQPYSSKVAHLCRSQGTFSTLTLRGFSYVPRWITLCSEFTQIRATTIFRVTHIQNTCMERESKGMGIVMVGYGKTEETKFSPPSLLTISDLRGTIVTANISRVDWLERQTGRAGKERGGGKKREREERVL